MNKSKLAAATAEDFSAQCWELAKQADGKWKLLDLAKHCFAKWQSEKLSNQSKTRMNVELRAKNQNITDRNRALRDERIILKRQLSHEDFLRSQGQEWRKKAWNANAQVDILANELEEAHARINGLLAEIHQLKQHLATQLVPVPNNPGMAFISYPN